MATGKEISSRSEPVTLARLRLKIRGMDGGLQGFLARVSKQYGEDFIVPQEAIELIQRGDNLSRKGRGRLYNLLVSGLGMPHTFFNSRQSDSGKLDKGHVGVGKNWAKRQKDRR